MLYLNKNDAVSAACQLHVLQKVSPLESKLRLNMTPDYSELSLTLASSGQRSLEVSDKMKVSFRVADGKCNPDRYHYYLQRRESASYKIGAHANNGSCKKKSKV